MRLILFRNTILDCGGWLACMPESISVTSVAAAVEAVDHTSDTQDPATEALEEHGESRPLPRMLVLPLTERLFVGATHKSREIDVTTLKNSISVLTGKRRKVEKVSTKVGDLREGWFNVFLKVLHGHCGEVK